jgi:hypothetical protein
VPSTGRFSRPPSHFPTARVAMTPGLEFGPWQFSGSADRRTMSDILKAQRCVAASPAPRLCLQQCFRSTLPLSGGWLHRGGPSHRCVVWFWRGVRCQHCGHPDDAGCRLPHRLAQPGLPDDAVCVQASL